jgi:DNA (cytosine-5)-methyltransferase 1
MVFEEVCVDLESQGYEVQPILLPACAVGAPHRRDRVWFVASNSNSIRQYECECDNEEQPSKRGINALNDITENVQQGNVTNSNSWGIQTRSQREVLEQSNRKTSKRFINVERGNKWKNFPTESPICSGDDGLSFELDRITFSKLRKESLKGYGNAIVPQVAYEIFKVIAEMDRLEKLQLKLF